MTDAAGVPQATRDATEDRSEDHGSEDHSSEDQRRSKRFRFKSKGKDRHRRDDPLTSSKRRHANDDDFSHQRSKRRKWSSHQDDPAAYDDSVHHLPPEQAFRESLFDALGDDEGAAFWEGVYGQPIHTYPNTYQDNETGELEKMTDEEYAQFVRQKMWEKSWEGIEAAKEEKRRAREEEKKQTSRDDNRRHGRTKPEDQRDSFIFDSAIEASLKRGEQRRHRQRWKGLWQDYLRRWEELQSIAHHRQRQEPDSEQLFLRNKIAWPVESGQRKDVHKEEIERFIRQGAASADGESDPNGALATALKAERIRWHPDKIQQRYGFMQLDDTTMKGVTAVFQVVDALWSDIKAKE